MLLSRKHIYIIITKIKYISKKVMNKVQLWETCLDLFIYLCICLVTYSLLFMYYLPIYLFSFIYYLFMYSSTHLFISLLIYVFIYVFIYLLVNLFIYLFLCLLVDLFRFSH